MSAEHPIKQPINIIQIDAIPGVETGYVVGQNGVTSIEACAKSGLLAALRGLLSDMYEIFASPDQLEMAAELARKGRSAIAADSDGPDTIKAARAAIARAENGGDHG